MLYEYCSLRMPHIPMVHCITVSWQMFLYTVMYSGLQNYCHP
uniref:Uncharacterized protein n=1 Tax=Anguilla anguilla TaxID=7936 RepID=A0A0E9PPP6_ANGAN